MDRVRNKEVHRRANMEKRLSSRVEMLDLEGRYARFLCSNIEMLDLEGRYVRPRDKPSGLFFLARSTFFHVHSFQHTFFLRLFVLFQSYCSHSQVFRSACMSSTFCLLLCFIIISAEQ